MRARSLDLSLAFWYFLSPFFFLVISLFFHFLCLLCQSGFHAKQSSLSFLLCLWVTVLLASLQSRFLRKVSHTDWLCVRGIPEATDSTLALSFLPCCFQLRLMLSVQDQSLVVSSFIKRDCKTRGMAPQSD